MSTKDLTGNVYVPDTYPHFQPIVLSSKSLFELHRETTCLLEEFVADHREKFPKGPIGSEASRR